MTCSLTKAYALIASATAALGGAIALATIFFNPPALAAAIALVLSVIFFFIPAIRAELTAYATCRGPSSRCSIARSIDNLGQVAGLVGVGSFVAALALQVAALGLLGSFFAAWAAPILIAIGEGLKWTGVAACGAGILLLAGLVTTILGYVSCRDEEDPGPPPLGSSDGGLTEGPGKPGV